MTLIDLRLSPSDPPIDPDGESLRHGYGAFPTGVTLVAAIIDSKPVGVAASSFTSVSLDPPLVSVCFARTSTTWPILRSASRWGISVLGVHQIKVLEQLRRDAAHRFDEVQWYRTDEGAVLLSQAAATFEVTQHDEVDAGDHVLSILRVHALGHDPDLQPLVFHRSRLQRLAV